MAAWPAIPESPQIGSLSVISDDNVLRTQNDVGPPIRRARYTAVSERYSFSLVLTKAELATLKTFYNTTLGLGVLSFTFTNPVTGSTENFYFAGPYTITALETIDYYEVGISLIREAA